MHNRVHLLCSYNSRDFRSELLRNHETNQDDMLEMDGFELLGHILQKVSPQFFTVDTIAALEGLASCVANNGTCVLACYYLSLTL
jgi:hypothetical protein